MSADPGPPLGRTRAGIHGRFFRPQEPAFWLYVAVVGLTAIFAIAEQGVYRRISPAGWLLSWALLLVYALPVLALLYVLDLHEREPVPLILASLVWGAVAATTLAGLANAGWGLVVSELGGPAFASRWTPALTAPFVEEALKGLGVVLIYLIARDEFDDMLDGFVYGAACGLGFAVVEDVIYFMGVFGGSTADVLRGSWSASSPAASMPTSCTPGSSGWGSATSSRRRGCGRRGGGSPSWSASAGSRCSATWRGTRSGSTSSRGSPGPGPSG
ncbi:MAG: PrsW family intramembrane metalloprotease [Actinomycetota bacterium]